MPRRNMIAILMIAAVSLVCYQRVERNHYGRYLTHALDAIDRYALERVPDRVLFDGAMEGIVGHLDQYSAYISARDAGEFQADLEQEFGGVGVVIRFEDEEKEDAAGRLTVVSPPLYGTPAYHAGIRARDKILEIDGEDTTGMTMKDIIRRMRGNVGDPIELTVMHEGETDPARFSMRRAIINVPSVLGDRPQSDGSWDFRLEQEPRIGYVRVISFGEKTIGELTKTLQSLQKQGVRGLVIDLRDNSGGLLDVAVETCDWFLEEGRTIVSIKGRGGRVERQFAATGDGPYANLSLAVLVNNYTASASEIVAACLQDHGRAIVVGERSWGKGTVQHVLRIESGGSILKLTTASYWRPSGKNIHRMKGAKPEEDWGVTPDDGLEVKLSDEQALELRKARSRRDIFNPAQDAADGSGAAEEQEPISDPQLQKAIEALRQEIDSPAQPQAA